MNIATLVLSAPNLLWVPVPSRTLICDASDAPLLSARWMRWTLVSSLSAAELQLRFSQRALRARCRGAGHWFTPHHIIFAATRSAEKLPIDDPVALRDVLRTFFGVTATSMRNSGVRCVDGNWLNVRRDNLTTRASATAAFEVVTIPDAPLSPSPSTAIDLPSDPDALDAAIGEIFSSPQPKEPT